MQNVAQSDVPNAKVARHDTDFSMCIICQKKSGQSLVEKPNAHQKVLKFMVEHTSYRDNECPEIRRRLRDLTTEDLVSAAATWHRKYYQDIVHAGMCRRVKDKYEKRLVAKGYWKNKIKKASSESDS